jgi:hypothetical protein
MRLSKAAQDGQNIKRPRAAAKKEIFAQTPRHQDTKTPKHKTLNTI